MSIAVQVLAAGDGFRVHDIICTHGPRDRAFEERHATMSIAIVTEGTFQYRSQTGAATLGPGALLLGNAGACYECGHTHAVGDRCLAFHLEPGLFESVLAGRHGGGRHSFRHASLPPLPRLVPLLAEAEAAREARDSEALEEIALRLASAASCLDADRPPDARAVSSRDERRITAALRRIERAPQAAHRLARVAAEAGMSRYHFLRVFRRVVGLTPHQYLLRLRLHRAAVRLRSSAEPITTVAYDSGFSDLSSFNHRFRLFFGTSPSPWRSR